MNRYPTGYLSLKVIIYGTFQLGVCWDLYFVVKLIVGAVNQFGYLKQNSGKLLFRKYVIVLIIINNILMSQLIVGLLLIALPQTDHFS